MPRNIPDAALLKLLEATGLEPVNIIRIQWIAGGGYYYYADRRIPEEPSILGQLIALDDLEAVVNIDKNATSTTVKVQLDDANGAIKAIFDKHDIHNRPVVIYQWFAEANFSINYKFPIFEGAIATPVEWDEGTRIMSFDVMSAIDDNEIGFSIEDGQFTDIPDILLGKSWPLVFGTVVDMPTLRMDEAPTGTTTVPLTIPDYSIRDHASYIDCQAIQTAAKATCLSLRAAELMTMLDSLFPAGGHAPDMFSNLILNDQNGKPVIVADLFKKDGDFSGKLYTPTEIKAMQDAIDKTNAKEIQEQTAYAQNLFNRARQLRCQSYQMINSVNTQMAPKSNALKLTFQQQREFDVSVIPIINGHKFRQGQQIEIVISGAKFQGSFEGDNFNVVSRTAPDGIERDPNGNVINNQPVAPVQPPVASLHFSECEEGSGAGMTSEGYWACDPPWLLVGCASNQKTDPQTKGQPWFANAGASVNVGSNYPIRYILSIIPGTIVLWLSARATVGAVKVITPIPPQYYTISLLQLGSITATIATFPQPLSTIPDNDWEDEVFATLQSPIGPNVVDIMIWAISNYTTKAYDAASFSHVGAMVAKYPANFALLDKKNIVTFLEEIAWQSRCSIWLADGKFFLKYLPEQSSPVDEVIEDDIEEQTLKITTTPTEDLVTKFIATWKASYSAPQPNKIILTYNINKYGIKERTFDFYIYNAVELVEKSAVFWLIRMANMWKKIQCRCFLSKLKAETMDNISVNLAHHSAANGTVIGVVEKATYNSAEYAIDMEVWLPVRIGEMDPYPFAYPQGISEQLLFPTVTDIAGKFATVPMVQQAQGSLGSVTPSIQKSGSRASNAQTAPSDQADSTVKNNIPPVITTTIGGAPYKNALAPPATPARQPTRDYTLPPVVPPVPRVSPIPLETPVPIPKVTVFPGKITEKVDGRIYKGVGYPDGLTGDEDNEDGVELEAVHVLHVDKDETLPEAWGFIVMQIEPDLDSDIEGATKPGYYFQPGVYIAPLEDS